MKSFLLGGDISPTGRPIGGPSGGFGDEGQCFDVTP